MIREIDAKDIPQLIALYDKFCKDEFVLPVPYLKLGEAAVKNSAGELIAYGFLEVFTEACIILDRDSTLREKAEAIARLISLAKSKAREKGIPAIYIFARDPEWSDQLKKHFGFEPCEGEALVMRLSHG